MGFSEHVLYTRQIAVLTIEEVAVLALGVPPPAVVRHHAAPDRGIRVQPRQEVTGAPVLGVGLPVTVRPEHLRPVVVDLGQHSVMVRWSVANSRHI